MKPLALAAALAGAIGLAACSSQAHPTSAAPANHPAASHSVVLVECVQKYHVWSQGPAKRFVGALNAIESASTTGRRPALAAALRRAKPAVLIAAHYPMPGCADPKGYWIALLMHVNAATGSENSASITLALKGVTKIEHALSTELKTTAGVK